MSEHCVKQLSNNICVNVPGSKSVTNRALLIAALGTGASYIRGCLKSEDSEHFLGSLKSLGFNIAETDNEIMIEGMGGIIPNKKAEIYVGSAGTAARFLTVMLAMSDGEYIVRASKQMTARPMKDLLVTLEEAGAIFNFMGSEYSLPFVVKGIFNSDSRKDVSDKSSVLDISVNIDKSSQYLSALLMAAPLLNQRVRIVTTGKRSAVSYVAITEAMMNDFGIKVLHGDEHTYEADGRQKYCARSYFCEPDVSAACYFYAMAAVTGRTAVVNGIHRDCMQGDIKFLDVLEKMGCVITDTEPGIEVTGPKAGSLKGIDVDMSDFSDQVLTLAAIAPFASSAVTIRNVAHIRNQESDRLRAAENELARLGIRCDSWEDGMTIYPGKPGSALIETYDDHRVAMSFAVTGTVSEGIVIHNPECCRKTFPEYFDILDSLAIV